MLYTNMFLLSYVTTVQTSQLDVIWKEIHKRCTVWYGCSFFALRCVFCKTIKTI